MSTEYKEKVLRRLKLFSPFSVSRINQHLEKGLSLSPLLEVLESKNQLPILKIAGKSLHSSYDPLKEAARKWTSRDYKEAEEVIFIGGDFLYEIEYWVSHQKSDFSKVTLHLVYSLENIFFQMLIHRSLDFLDLFKKVEVYLPGDGKYFLENFLLISQGGYSVFLLDNEKLFSETLFLKEVKNIFFDVKKIKISSQITNINFEIRWLKNTLKNLKGLDLVYPLATLKNSFKNCSALVVGAGLSIYDKFKDIKKLKESGSILIIVDTILPAFLKRGIIPDFIISLDGGYYNSLDFFEMPPQETTLITSFILYPSVFRNFPGKKYVFNSTPPGELPDNLALGIIEEIIFSKNSFTDKERADNFIATGSSVLSTSLEIVFKLGFSQISFWGVDLKGIFFQNHLFESMHLELYNKKSHRLNPTIHQEFLEVKDSLNEEDKLNFKKGDDFFIQSFNLKKYQKEFETIIEKNPYYYWKNRGWVEISLPVHSKVSLEELSRLIGKKQFEIPKIKTLIERATKKKIITDFLEKIIFLEKKIVNFLKESNDDNFLKLLKILEGFFYFNNEFKELKKKSQEEKSLKQGVAYQVFKKVAIIKREMMR